MSQLICKNLLVGYEGKAILDPLNFEIHTGDYLCVVGENGAGKSTLMKTLLGLQQPISGQIEMGDGLRRNEIGYLPQQAVLLPSSVMNNITMFDPDLESKAKASAADAQLSEAVDSWPQGLETPVDLAGDNLSGGQKQKVVLARAEVRDSQLLLVDEGTSAIDHAAGRKILDKLLQSKQTVVLIAHNLTKEERDLFDREIKLSA